MEGHPRIPPYDTITLCINTTTDNRAGMHTFADRKTPVMVSETIMGKETGLAACWRGESAYKPLSADLLRTLLAALVRLRGCGCMQRPQHTDGGVWIGDPGLYLLNTPPMDIAANTEGWSGLHRSHANTRALVPLNIQNQHWVLLQIERACARCTVYDSLPYSQFMGDMHAHILATTRLLFPRIAAPMALNTRVIDRQYDGANDCAIHVFLNAWRATSSAACRTYTYYDVRTIRELWLPALVFSNQPATGAPRYPWTHEDTVAAFGRWLDTEAQINPGVQH